MHVSYKSAEGCHPKIEAIVKELVDGKYKDEGVSSTLAEEAGRVKYLESVLKQLSDDEVERVRDAANDVIDHNEAMLFSHHMATAAFLPVTVAKGALRCDHGCLWSRKYSPQKRDMTIYDVPAPRPARMFGYDLDILFNRIEEAKVAEFLQLDSELFKHASGGSRWTWFPFMVMETKASAISSHDKAVNELARAGSFGAELIDRLFRRAAVYLDDASSFPDPLSTLSFGYTVTADSVSLWYSFIGSERVNDKDERAYYTHHIQSFLLSSCRKIRAFYATVLRILVLSFTTRLEDIKKALRLLALPEQRSKQEHKLPKDPDNAEFQGLLAARGTKRPAGDEGPEVKPDPKRIDDGSQSSVIDNQEDAEALEGA